GRPTGTDVKLFDWIKGAVAFTKAPAGPQTAPPPEPPAPPPPRTEVSPVAPPAPPAEPKRDAARVIEPLAREAVTDEAPASAEPPTATADPKPAINLEPAAATKVEPPIRIGAGAGGVPTQEEIERRRGLVRKFFNDYWSSIDDKPASFAERLDGAEG